ncbi:MAG: carboxy terminal-processing peptidase [Pseudohongiellaceae bacterium]
MSTADDNRSFSRLFLSAILLLMVIGLLPFSMHGMAADEADEPPADRAEEEIIDEDGLPDELVLDELYTELSSEPVYGETAIELLKELESKHYSDVVFDERFSERVFTNYIDALDGSKLYFLQSDLDEFSRYRDGIAAALESGDLQPAFDIYNRYVVRVMERLIWTIEHVENDLAELDFTVEEYLQIDREEAEWASSEEALDELWRLRVKNSALSLKLTGMEMDTVEERLSERYRNQLSQLTKTNNRDVFQSYLSTVAKTVDPHTGYFSPRDSENFNMGLRGSLQGIGAQLTSEGEFTKVAELIKGGPAEQAGELKAGDRIIAIGQGESGEMKDVIGLRLDDVVDQIRGEKGTVVRLNVIPAEATSEAAAREVAITRDTVELSEQFASSEVIDVEMDGQQYRVGVITLPSFYLDFQAAQRGEEDYRSSSRDVAALLEELQEEDVEAVVMDLRYNGGGSLNEANELVGLFIEGGPTVQVRYSGLRNGFVRSYGDTDSDTAYDGPLAVLVNRASASASEIFAGAIQDYQRGVVLGGQTFGKGTVQEIIPMDYGQVKLTRSKFYRISGASTQHRGVMPDIEFPDRYQVIDSMGESNLDGALPWDTVRPVEYETYYPLRQIMPELQERHQTRAARDPDFIYLNSAVERMRDVRERTHLPLQESALLEQREADRRAAFNANNLRRMMKGLPMKLWQDSDNDEDDGESVSLSLGTDDLQEEGEEDIDPVLIESGHILVDMSRMLGRPMTASHDAGETDRRDNL